MIPRAEQAPEPAPVVKVKVTRNRAGDIKIDCSHAVPRTGVIITFLPADIRKKCPTLAHYNGEALAYVIAVFLSNISLAVWQDAIAKCIMSTLINERAAETMEETVLQGPVRDAYMAMGDILYQLRPIDLVQTSGALKTMRRRILAQSKEEVARIEANARTNAQLIEQQAAAKLAEANERVREAARTTLVPPRWMIDAGQPIKRDEACHRWCVGISFQCRLEKFQWYSMSTGTGRIQKKEWAGVLPRQLLPLFMWVPIGDDGTYRANECYLSSCSEAQPHINRTRACMSPADLPTQILNHDHLMSFINSVQRCLKVVDLTSLLGHFTMWGLATQAMCPPPLQEALKIENDQRRYDALLALAATTDTSTTARAEASETFTAI